VLLVNQLRVLKMKTGQRVDRGWMGAGGQGEKSAKSWG
jgi:hypothetical protein